jgi:hypothetical protein
LRLPVVSKASGDDAVISSLPGDTAFLLAAILAGVDQLAA